MREIRNELDSNLSVGQKALSEHDIAKWALAELGNDLVLTVDALPDRLKVDDWSLLSFTRLATLTIGSVQLVLRDAGLVAHLSIRRLLLGSFLLATRFVLSLHKLLLNDLFGKLSSAMLLVVQRLIIMIRVWHFIVIALRDKILMATLLIHETNGLVEGWVASLFRGRRWFW